MILYNVTVSLEPEIEMDWLSGKQCIGVTAGASTPDEAIEEVVLKLKSLASGN